MMRGRSARPEVTLAEMLESAPTPHIPDYVDRRLTVSRSADSERSSARRYRTDVCCSLCERLEYPTGGRSEFPHGVRPYTVREYTRLQGVPDAFTFSGSDNDAYRMIGNGVSVPVGQWIASEIVRYFN
jgi:DNA (cytosine-5)-methyltransferase 1